MSDEENYQEKTVNYRKEVLELIYNGRIKHTVKWAEKASDEKLEKTYTNYLSTQLDETNELLTDAIFRTDDNSRAC